MYLKRITITGFKSFASKTVLELGRGMTAVVGPNGSGKSNVADAIRWALGEQSKSRLRLGDREEVVFAGTDKRARASFAEVVLLFDNEAGSFPLDLTEVEISRRLYRSGETDYRLAGRAVKLGDLQQLLAEAGFGVNSYAVVGQGMIDSLLLSSPAERKLLFQEAAGIRGPELSRDAAVRKLNATEVNLVRLRDIAAELAPQAASLERAKAAAADEAKLAGRVDALKSIIVATATAEITHNLAAAEHEERQAQAESANVAAELAKLEGQQSKLQANIAAQAQAATLATHVIGELETARDDAAQALGAAQARLVQTEAAVASAPDGHHQLQASRTRLSDINQSLADTADELKSNHTGSRRAEKAVEDAAVVVKATQAELLEVRQQLSDGTRQQYVGHALSLVKSMAYQLDAAQPNHTELRLLVHKTGRLLSHASRTGEAELATQLKAAQTKLELAMAKRETAVEHQTNLTLSRRSLELDQIHMTTEKDQLEALITQLEINQAAIAEAKASQNELEVAVQAAGRDLDHVTSKLEAARSQAQATTGTSVQAAAELAVAIERANTKVVAIAATISRAMAAKASLKHELEMLERRARDWQVADVRPDASHSASELEAQLGRLESELDARRELGRGLADEYQQVSTRQAELVEQVADLEAAKVDLETLVEKLSAAVQERFATNFERLGIEFSRQAERLFDGGSASLSLDEDEAGQYGIQIKLSPKGKRLSSLASLSGGERALAGVALLSAILIVNPSPFVVLDEIDAALDDANAGRLADIMQELAEHSQLIVITHNRQTMQAAKVLFGVTMNEHHVSHLLSLQLEQATQMAAR